MGTGTEVAVQQQQSTAVIGLDEVQHHVQLLRDVMRSVMVRGVHYGVIEGCSSKPVLLKPGAELLGLMFGLAPEFAREIYHDADEFRVLSQCTLRRRDGSLAASASAIASSTEARFQRRDGRPQDPFTYNVVLKIADKRAYVSAILYATGGSELWTCDLEDLPPESIADIRATTPKQAPQPQQPEPQVKPTQQQSPAGAGDMSYRMPDGDRVAFTKCATPAICAKCGGKTTKISARGYCYLCERADRGGQV